MTFIELVNLKLAVITVLAQAFIVVALVCLLLWKGKYKAFENIIARYGLIFAFIVSLVATLGSLFYSEIAHFDPCGLCWYQRIFMYPQVLLLGLALFKKDRSIIDYSLLLSVVGALFAGYHYLMQLGIVSGACDIVGYSVSCAKLFVMQFGYVTIPLMALTAFVLMIVLLYYAKMKQYN